MKCALCNEVMDSRPHLFFQCQFADVIWSKVRKMGRFSGVHRELGGIVNIMALCTFKNNIWHVVNRLVLAATVYYLWEARNYRLFRNEKRKAEIYRIIISNVKDKLLSLRVRKSKAVLLATNKCGLRWFDMQLETI